MSKYRKLTLVGCTAVLALGLAACGSSSDDDDQAMMDCPVGQVGTYPDCSDPPPEPAIAQREVIDDAIMAAQTAVDAVDNDSTDAEVTAADTAITNARNAIAAAANVPAEEKTANSGTVNALQNQLSRAVSARQMAMDDADDAANMAMGATARKLYVGLEMPPTTTDTGAAGNRFAAYTGTNDSQIAVSINEDEDVLLSEDKETTVADNHGWKGKRYADPTGGDSYEAVVYSNVEAPTMGKKFGSAAIVTDTGAFQYQLTNGALPSTFEYMAANVGLTGVTRTAGTETFKLPEGDQSGATTITGISGSYHGVSGNYNCNPSDEAVGCTAAVAAKGFTLDGGDWTFTPSDPNARVMSSDDNDYASYGWWLRKAENDGPFTASVFHGFKGTPGTVEIAALRGKATYMGAAAGKYALSSSTGGTNDAGHFTARAILEAEFAEEHTISGTIDQFIGADGESREWSVELMESVIADDGGISRAAENDTVWTIGGIDGAASGEWSGNLREEGTDGVPKVATGIFNTEYGTAGRMVGAFGANKQ